MALPLELPLEWSQLVHSLVGSILQHPMQPLPPEDNQRLERWNAVMLSLLRTVFAASPPPLQGQLLDWRLRQWTELTETRLRAAAAYLAQSQSAQPPPPPPARLPSSAPPNVRPSARPPRTPSSVQPPRGPLIVPRARPSSAHPKRPTRQSPRLKTPK